MLRAHIGRPHRPGVEDTTTARRAAALAPITPITPIAAIALGCALAGCDWAPPPAAVGAPLPSRPATVPVTGAIEDLPRIRWHRELRVLVPDLEADDGDSPSVKALRRRERALIEAFAEEHYVVPKWVRVGRWEDLIPALRAGRGHLIGASLSVSEPRQRHVRFTVPLESHPIRLVVRAGDAGIRTSELDGRQIAVRAHSDYWPLVQRLRKRTPDLEVKVLDEWRSAESVLQAVATGRLDIAAIDTTVVMDLEERWPVLRTVERPVASNALALALHPDAPELFDALNRFIVRSELTAPRQAQSTGDLDTIRKRGRLRLVTLNDAASYFVWRGELAGFDHDLLKRFAERQGVELDVIVAGSADALAPMLRTGKGDVAAGIEPGAGASGDGVRFTRPYAFARPMLAGTRTLGGPLELDGARVVARRGSIAWRLMERLGARIGLRVTLLDAGPEKVTDDYIDELLYGGASFVALDEHRINAAMAWREDVRPAIAIGEPEPRAWAVRGNNPALLAALDAYIEKEYRGRYYNLTRSKYFRRRAVRRTASAPEQAPRTAPAAAPGGARWISPFDEHTRKLAQAHGFDWTFIAAQIAVESRFDPKARSFAGARGLMQLMPATAKRFGVKKLEHPEESITAGVRYMAWLRQRFEGHLAVRERLWFTLAAYNAGLGHVFDARRLAEELGLDPNRWFDHVEKAMELLSRPRYYRRAEHGYARGSQTVAYVRSVRERYEGYRQLVSR